VEKRKRHRSRRQRFERSKTEEDVGETMVCFDGSFDLSETVDEDLDVGSGGDDLFDEGMEGREVEEPGSFCLGREVRRKLEEEFGEDSDGSEDDFCSLTEFGKRSDGLLIEERVERRISTGWRRRRKGRGRERVTRVGIERRDGQETVKA